MIKELNELKEKLEIEKESKENLLNDLRQRQFSFVDKIFNKKKIKENSDSIKLLEDDIASINNKLSDASYEPNLFSLMSSCEKNNIKSVITDDDLSYIFPSKDLSSLDDIMLVHKSSHKPVNDVLTTSRNGSKDVILNEKMGDYEYSIVTKKGRDTIHFCANHEVKEHLMGNEWNSQKYAILIPFNDIDKGRIGQASAVDTYVYGDINLTSNSIIVVPEDEVEETKRQNPKCNVVGYDKSNVKSGNATCVLNLLGYKEFEADQYGIRDNDLRNKYDKLMNENGFTQELHSNTIDMTKERYIIFNDIIIKTIDKYIEGYNENRINDISLLSDKVSSYLPGLLDGDYKELYFDKFIDEMEAKYNLNCLKDLSYLKDKEQMVGKTKEGLRDYMKVFCHNLDEKLSTKELTKENEMIK